MPSANVKFLELSPHLQDFIKRSGQVMLQTGTVPVLDRQPNHDLFDFMTARTQELNQEYLRIQKRVSEDPGTAGDQGEENWASLLRNWLPPMFPVVTRGRIISHDGIASPQVDILVLHPTYPLHLRDKKLYLAGAVVAAFECKITLRAEHIREAISNCLAIKKHVRMPRGTPYRELHSSIIYGLLSHSHCWKEPNSSPLSNIYDTLYEQDFNLVDHPRSMLDLLCVADLGYWNSVKSIFTRSTMGDQFESSKISTLFDGKGICGTGYNTHNYSDANQIAPFTPIGALLSELLIKIAWQNPEVRPIAQYFRSTYISGSGKGVLRQRSLDVFSQEVLTGILGDNKLVAASPFEWNEWSAHFN